jgi:prephenate dehydrogenase
MPIEFTKIQEIARASLMPDFFAVRIDEEGLFARLKQLIARIQLSSSHPQLAQIKQMSAAAPSANEFIEAIKRENLFTTLREILTKIQVT